MPLHPIVRLEDIDERLDTLAKELAEAGRQVGDAARAKRRAAGKVIHLTETPRFADEFLAEAREALEDEIDIARPATAENDIEPSEIEREVAKKALAVLKLEQLRRVASYQELDYRGDKEVVIDRIVQALNADRARIARLVLENEEARPERGLADRLFPILGMTVDAEAAERRLEQYAQRYIRTGIARWFVFGTPDRRDGVIWLDGTFRTYQVDPYEEDDFFDLTSIPDASPVRVRLEDGGMFIQTRAPGVTESRAATQAVMKLLGLRPWHGLPIETKPREGPLLRWDHRSVYMAAFLQNELNRDGIEVLNLTSAHFETGESTSGEDLRPNVRSVRFEGAHLLDSKPACELLVEGRGLVGMSLLVRFSPSRDVRFVLPIHISLERDHVTVLTGFGTERHEVANDLQRELVTRVKASLGRPLKNEPRLNRTAAAIERMLRQAGPVERARFFAPERSWRDDDSGTTPEIAEDAAPSATPEIIEESGSASHSGLGPEERDELA